MRKPIKNVGASVRARLQSLAEKAGTTVQLLHTKYVLERLLYRLSTSKHKNRFILKGALLVATWFETPHRPTRDLDLLGKGPSAPEELVKVFEEVLSIEQSDGVKFDVKDIKAEEIRSATEYGGVRIRTTAELDGARVPVLVDVAFGDAVPEVIKLKLPVLLDMAAPVLSAYPPESVIAEKLQAMVQLGRANSRMKDFFDIWMLAQTHKFAGDDLAQAILATFNRRETEIPEEAPDALTADFSKDKQKKEQWDAFKRQAEVEAPSLAEVIDAIAKALTPHLRKAEKLASKAKKPKL